MARKKASRAQAKKETPPRETTEHPGAPSPESQSCLVAGFGASAGGLEAFTDVLHRLPNDTGLSLVFIQHLDPKHSSVLTELLARATRMPVVQVAGGMPIKPNHVYVIPPNTNISVSGGSLRVQPRPPGRPHMPVDHFLRSLAQEQGNKAIGVVLSGTASDGTLGLKAIKAEGGITFAQSPDSAKYDGMPRSAVAAGCVDFVLTPEQIAVELVRLCRHPYLITPRPAEPPCEAEKEFSQIFAALRSATGVDFTHYKSGTINRRMHRRMALHKLDTPGQYADFLREHSEEMDLLFQDLLINVTGFFREPATFAAIRTKLLPALFKNRPSDEAARVWVPGCSTGEEAYSVAICLLEHLREMSIEIPIQVFGTDLSEAALQKARAGVYPESIQADVSAERLRRFFSRAEGGYQIARFVRDTCVFARQNVTKDPPFSRLDLITCRNLLIYLGPVLQGRVMRLFHYALKPSGHLVLGASEHIGAVGETLFDAVDKQHRIYARKPIQAVIHSDFGGYEERAAHGSPSQPVPAGPADVQVKVDRMILARYSPPAIVVDKELRVLQFRGDTSGYLGHAPGEASLDLARLARRELVQEVRRLVEKADVTATLVRGEALPLALDHQHRHARISITPLHGVEEPRFLVVFEEVPAARPEPAKVQPAPKRKGESQHVQELEQELATTQHYLQSLVEEQEAATEELKSAHEEVQSSNEELQSTNEELLTAKEELQSTNEELTTVNEEMQGRNVELQQINNDLLNLLSSVNIPILMLGNDLRIRRFTPQAERLLNLIPSDVGRPISDLRLKINLPDVVALCHEVIDTLASREREVEDADGHVYSMWMRPYRTYDNRIDGVVFALMDVTERKRAAEARYRRLFEAAKDGVVIADAATGEIVDSNPFATKLLGHPRSALLGVRFWESALFRDSEIDESILLELQEREFVQKSLSLLSESGEPVEVEVVASLYAEGNRTVAQFNIRDITARRRLEERHQRGEEQQRQAQKMEAVGRLAGGVAHDFNNILTAVLGYTDLLAQDLEDDHPGHASLRQIRAGADRAVALTRQLLTFGRKQVVSPAVLGPNDVIADTRQMIGVMLSRGVRLEMALAPDAGYIRADRTQVEQIVLNLVLNARDATADGGSITVSTANVDVDGSFAARHPAVPVGRYVAISIKDTGTGMDEETKSHIFEPFFTTKPKGGGVGLGLATVQNIVRQNGGYVWAYSELGVGSTFTVYLPRVEAEAVLASTAAAPPTEAVGTETILLVDDEPAVRSLARRFLELRGYRVLEASGGPEALRISREHDGPIHLMMTDVIMPRMSGRELAFQLASERPAMKVLYVSGHTEDAIIHHGVLRQGFAFLQKPFTQQTLVSRVRELLDATEEQSPAAVAGEVVREG
jgi:two-component system, chemotaxis family, CheB/CheR fusion protein